jgi:uncharacterized damage-inducible protein DinB
MDIEHLKYPIGKYQPPSPISQSHISQWIEEIAAFPPQLRATVQGMTEAQLSTAYREGGWTVRQVLHHVPDSHMNAYIRFKWTLTEETPTIKAYFEDRWAKLEDSQIVPVEIPLNLLGALHKRWIALLRSMKAEDFARKYIHPQYGREYSLEEALGLYAWHGNHHRAQIEALKKRMGWNKP